MIKITIAIPAYNVEAYVERCLQSTVSQDLPSEEYEVIIINDGSTDGTLERIRLFSAEHPNIVVFDKKNEGLSLTRNMVIDKARGEYILFLDSDDYLQDNCLQDIYTKMSINSLDILEHGFVNVDGSGKELEHSAFDYITKRESGCVVTGRDYMLQQNDIVSIICSKVYRLKFLRDNNLRMFPIRHEDEEFTPRALYLAKRVMYDPARYYIYVVREGSIMSSYRETNFFDIVTAMGRLNDFLRTRVSADDIEICNFFNNRISMLTIQMFKRSVKDGHTFQPRLTERIKESGLFPLCPTKKSFYVKLFNISPMLLARYYKMKFKFKL